MFGTPFLNYLCTMAYRRETVIVSVGSNTYQQNSVQRAKRLILELLDDVVFTCDKWTDPVGMESPQFINCLVKGTTTHDKDQLVRALKNIERRLGDSRGMRTKNVVVMDLDLLQYGDEKLHLDHWERPYMDELLGQLGEKPYMP